MKKLALLLALLLPLAVTAQTEPPVIHEFYKTAKGLVATFKLSDDVNVMQVNTDNNNFDMLAINSQMKVVWRVNLPGHAMAAGNFKGKIVAVATTDYSEMKRTTNNEYKGYLLDPATGKTIVDKIIYTGSATQVEIASFYFNEAGDYFKMAVVQTALANRMHIAMPGPLALISVNKADKQIHTTKGFAFVDFDINLDQRYVWEPSIPEGYMVSYTCNDKGHFFVAWDKEPGALAIFKYETGKSEPIGSASIMFPLRKNMKVNEFNQRLVLTASKTNSDVAYAGLLHENEGKELQLSLAKFDVLSKTSQLVSEEFTKDHVKQLEKSFVPITKKVADPELGSIGYLNVKDITEVAGELVVRISGSYQIISRMAYTVEKSSVINVYDLNLKPRFQQIIPAEYTNTSSVSYSLHHEGDKLYFVVPDSKGPKKVNALFCT